MFINVYNINIESCEDNDIISNFDNHPKYHNYKSSCAFLLDIDNECEHWD